MATSWWAAARAAARALTSVPGRWTGRGSNPGMLTALLATLALVVLASCANPWIHDPQSPGAKASLERRNKPSHLVVGNYCGYGTRSGNLSQKPQDRLDAACLEHDACFIARRDRCECNDALVAAARAIIADPQTQPDLRARARVISDFFPVVRPICMMFPQGIMPPRKTDVLKTRYHAPGAAQ